jgi:acid phosphatase (class B)
MAAMASRTCIAAALLALLAACSREPARTADPAAAPNAPRTEAAAPAAKSPAPAPAKPKVVGFDVDDTLLFSTPAFDAGFGAKGVKAYSEKFWTIVNGADEGRSIVKKKAKEILERHRAEGAKIFAVTARHPHGGEALKAFLFKAFGIPPENTFFETEGKAETLRKLGIEVFYGDSDSDIEAAIDAGGRGVRILRSPKSSYKKKYNPGKLGEEIVQGSEE